MAKVGAQVGHWRTPKSTARSHRLLHHVAIRDVASMARAGLLHAYPGSPQEMGAHSSAWRDA